MRSGQLSPIVKEAVRVGCQPPSEYSVRPSCRGITRMNFARGAGGGSGAAI